MYHNGTLNAKIDTMHGRTLGIVCKDTFSRYTIVKDKLFYHTSTKSVLADD